MELDAYIFVCTFIHILTLDRLLILCIQSFICLGILASIKFKETNVDHLRHGILNARDVKARRQARGDDTSIPSALVDPQAQDTSNNDNNESEDSIAESAEMDDSLSENDDEKLSNNLKSQSLDVDDEGDDSPLANAVTTLHGFTIDISNKKDLVNDIMKNVMDAVGIYVDITLLDMMATAFLGTKKWNDLAWDVKCKVLRLAFEMPVFEGKLDEWLDEVCPVELVLKRRLFCPLCVDLCLPSNEPSISTQPTGDPSSGPSQTPSELPSISGQPSSVPSESSSVTFEPSNVPSLIPSLPSQFCDDFCIPSDEPSISTQPSEDPSSGPSQTPSELPSISGKPSSNPSEAPSVSTKPSSQPSENPSLEPSNVPSLMPSNVPSQSPSGIPSMKSETPSNLPSFSVEPSKAPSGQPSFDPTGQPSSSPSAEPSSAPSDNPSRFGAGCCAEGETLVCEAPPTPEPSSPTLEPTPCIKGQTGEGCFSNDDCCGSLGKYQYSTLTHILYIDLSSSTMNIFLLIPFRSFPISIGAH